jgi:signal peptidase I
MAEPYKKSAGRDTLESLVVTVILAVFGTTFVVQAFKIPTGSMENTLLIGDHLLVNKFVFAVPKSVAAPALPYREVRRGDIVVFKFPPSDDPEQRGEHFVKRVIGLPGDRVRIFHREVFINGVKLDEPYVRHIEPEIRTLGDDFPPPPENSMRGYPLRWREELAQLVENGELVVPPGRYFVMGDNREASWDSRFWGFVPRELITGRPLVIYWSLEANREDYFPTSVLGRLKRTAMLVVQFPVKTRWSRTFSVVR